MLRTRTLGPLGRGGSSFATVEHPTIQTTAKTETANFVRGYYQARGSTEDTAQGRYEMRARLSFVAQRLQSTAGLSPPLGA